MIDIKKWINEYTGKVQIAFSDRIEFVGLQGSYARGEATEHSDIDIVLILDTVDINDFQRYDDMLSQLPYRDKVCGFISGKAEITNWDTSDLFQFYFDTVPIIGNLNFIKKSIDDNSVLRAVHISACNIYHSCVHNILHEKDIEILKALYKSAVFTIQAKHYLKTDVYIKQKSELIKAVPNPEKEILMNYNQLNSKVNKNYDFYKMSNILFRWSGNLIKNQKNIIKKGEYI